MRSSRHKSRLPVSTNTNNNKMAVASLPSTYTKFPLRILNKGPDFFRDQVVHDQRRPQKSAAERLAETRTQYVKGYSTESEPQEKVTVHKGGKETTRETSQKTHLSPKKKNRTGQKQKVHTTEQVFAAETTDAKSHKHVLKEDTKRLDVITSCDSPQISDSEEEMKGVGNLISHYQRHKNKQQGGNDVKPTNTMPQFGKKSPPRIPKKPKRCASPSNRSCSDSDEMPFKRISVKQAAKSWENVSGMLENHKNGVRKQVDIDQLTEGTNSVQKSLDGNNVKTANIAKAWEKLASDLDGEENGKKSSPPPKVKLIDSVDHDINSYHQKQTKTSAVKVKLTDAATISHSAKQNKPLKVQLINSYNSGKNREEDSQQNAPTPIRAKVKLVDTNMNVTGGTVFERKDPKRAIRAKVEHVDNFAMGKVTNYPNHVSGNRRPRVQSQLSTQSEDTTTDSSVSAKVRLLLVQSKENQAVTNSEFNTITNDVTNKGSPIRGRSKTRKASDNTKDVEHTKQRDRKTSKRSPQHHARSKSSGPLYRMQLGSSQDSAQSPSYDSTKNTTDTSSPRSSSPCLGSPRGSRIRRLQEQLLALCDTEDSSSFESPDSLGEGRFVRSRSTRSYSKESTMEERLIPRRGSAPARHKAKEPGPLSSRERSKVSAKENVIVERRDMPVPIVCTARQNFTERSKVKNRSDTWTDVGRSSNVIIQRKDTKSSFDSTDARLASASETTSDFKEAVEKQTDELVIVERPNDLVTGEVGRMEAVCRDDSPSSSVKEKYSRMTTVMLGSGVKTEIGVIDTLPISVDVEVEFDGSSDQKTATDKHLYQENVFEDHSKKERVSNSELKGVTRNDHHYRTEQLKNSSRKQIQTSTDSEDIPFAASKNKSALQYETPCPDAVDDSKQHRKSSRDTRKKLFSLDDPNKHQSADQIKSCHSPNMNNNRASDGFQRGTQMRRSCSDLDPPYLRKAHTELDRFFDQMGLDESVLKRIDAYPSPMEEEAFHPMHEMKYYDSDSMYSNDSDNLSQGSKVSDDGLLRRHLTSRLPDQSQSIVMRNARVIKWLCQCRKARTQSVS